MGRTSYAIALGSNRPHGRHGGPRRVVEAAIEAIARLPLEIGATSTIRASPAMGGAGRSFANAAILLCCEMDPAGLLDALKAIERGFGRRSGRRWGPRVLDLDILLWSEGTWTGGKALVPHYGLQSRHFVLQPLEEIAPSWRHPLLGLTIRQLRSRLRRAKPVDRAPRPPLRLHAEGP